MKMNMQQMLENACWLARTGDNLREMRQEIRSGQAEIKSAIEEGVKAAIQSIRSERDGMIQHQVEIIMTHVIHETQSLQKACLEMTACYEATERDTEKTEPNPEMMAVADHQEVPKEEAAVKSSGTVKK
jgi:hypothetical protein